MHVNISKDPDSFARSTRGVSQSWRKLVIKKIHHFLKEEQVLTPVTYSRMSRTKKGDVYYIHIHSQQIKGHASSNRFGPFGGL